MSAGLFGAKLLDAGETALLVEFGKTVDMAIHDRVMALDRAVAEASIDGVRETVPTYRSLLIHYDPLEITREELIEHLSALNPGQSNKDSKSWLLPVCFDPELADDLDDASERLGLSITSVEEGLLASKFRLYMYGFAPGFAYLGGLEPQLTLPRRKTPRPLMPEGSIIIAGGLAAIGAVAMPTGWYVVAATPVRMFDAHRLGHVPFGVGDEIRFERVSRPEFDSLKARGLSGKAVWREAA